MLCFTAVESVTFVNEVSGELGYGVNKFELLRIMNNVRVFLLVMDKTAAVRTCPVTLVTFVRVFSGMSSPMVYQVIRPLELFAAEVAGVPEIGFVDQLMLLQRMLQLKRHATVLPLRVSVLAPNHLAHIHHISSSGFL